MEAAGSRGAALHLHRAESFGHGQRRRRDHRRAAQRHRRRSGPGDPQFQPVLRHRPGKALGLHPIRLADRDGLFPDCDRAGAGGCAPGDKRRVGTIQRIKYPQMAQTSQILSV